MYPEQMQVFIQRFDDIFNKPDVSIVDEILAPQFIAHVPMMPILNRSSYRSFLSGFIDSFPNSNIKINDQISSNEKLVLRTTYYGTHGNDFLGIPATGYSIVMPAITIFRIEGDSVVEGWSEMDIIDVIRQISPYRFVDEERLASIN